MHGGNERGILRAMLGKSRRTTSHEARGEPAVFHAKAIKLARL
jgi:hypothetical protein